MAWGPGGEELRARMKIELSRARSAVYDLTKTAKEIKHDEKGPVLIDVTANLVRLVEVCESLWAQLDRVEFQLNR